MAPRLVILDRDGVINQDSDNYIKSLAEWVPYPSAITAIARLSQQGWTVAVATNQSGIARGYYTEADMQALHDHMTKELKEAGAHIDRFYHAPWHEDGEIARYRKSSIDRKPGPGMLLQAMADFNVNREQSFLIGDKETDLDAARAAGVGAFLFRGGNLGVFAEWALASFEDGVRG